MLNREEKIKTYLKKNDIAMQPSAKNTNNRMII